MKTELNYSEYIFSEMIENRKICIRLEINYEDQVYTIKPMYDDKFAFINGNNLGLWDLIASLIKSANIFACNEIKHYKSKTKTK